jgi:hypothetical protein
VDNIDEKPSKQEESKNEASNSKHSDTSSDSSSDKSSTDKSVEPIGSKGNIYSLITSLSMKIR